MQQEQTPLNQLGIIGLATSGILFVAGCGASCLMPVAVSGPATYEEDKAELRELIDDYGGCEGLKVELGTCHAAGLLFTSFRTDFGGDIRYYDDRTARFEAHYSYGDVYIPFCGTSMYWPRRIECSDRAVTQTLCDSLLFEDPAGGG